VVRSLSSPPEEKRLRFSSPASLLFETVLPTLPRGCEGMPATRPMSAENLLIVADSERDANMLYAVGMFVPDPFIFLRLGDQSQIVLNDLEIDRGRKQAQHCQIVSLSRCLQQVRRNGAKARGFAHVIRMLARTHGVKKLLVPETFPYGLARELRRLKLRLKVKSPQFFPEREFKTAEEVKKISAALMMAEVGMAEGIQALKNAKVGSGGKLYYHSVLLTSEKLRSVIDTAVIQAGGVANHTIVACGKQGCDPHEVGHGPLRANQPIILDIYPRSQKTGYFGDITRTVVKGRAPEAVRKLYHTVRAAQDLGLALVRDQAKGKEVHQAVQEFFTKQGYRTGRVRGRMEGFFHGTGHGLGLEIHEAPRLGVNSDSTLRPGHVVTVEPGLYYPPMGGVRLEDVALVTTNGARNLSKFEKVLEV